MEPGATLMLDLRVEYDEQGLQVKTRPHRPMTPTPTLPISETLEHRRRLSVSPRCSAREPNTYVRHGQASLARSHRHKIGAKHWNVDVASNGRRVPIG